MACGSGIWPICVRLVIFSTARLPSPVTISFSATFPQLVRSFHIPKRCSPLPGRNNRIRNSPTGKISLSVITAAKVSHFEILCRVHGFVPTVGNFCKFNINSKNKEMDLFAFIRYADPTKVRIGEKKIEEGQVPLLESTRGRVDARNNVTGEGAADGQEILVDAGIIRIEDEVPATVVNKPKGTRKKRKIASGGSGSALPPKRLREDYGTSGDAGASTAGKSLT
ncbi:hypothetical protein Tco_0980524, partial [Tanacetum coccineum]